MDKTLPSLFKARDGGLDAISEALNKGGNSNEKENGRTILDWAASCRYIDVVRLLLEHGADPNLADDPDPDDYGRFSRPLFAVVGSDANKDIVALLLKSGADPNLTDDQGITPLISATLRGALENCKQLVAAGAEPQHRTKEGHDALFFAVNRNLPLMVSYLLDLGLDPAKRINEQNSAIETAQKKQFQGILEIFKERGFF